MRLGHQKIYMVIQTSHGGLLGLAHSLGVHVFLNDTTNQLTYAFGINSRSVSFLFSWSLTFLAILSFSLLFSSIHARASYVSFFKQKSSGGLVLHTQDLQQRSSAPTLVDHHSELNTFRNQKHPLRIRLRSRIMSLIYAKYAGSRSSPPPPCIVINAAQDFERECSLGHAGVLLGTTLYPSFRGVGPHYNTIQLFS